MRSPWYAFIVRLLVSRLRSLTSQRQGRIPCPVEKPMVKQTTTMGAVSGPNVPSRPAVQ